MKKIENLNIPRIPVSLDLHFAKEGISKVIKRWAFILENIYLKKIKRRPMNCCEYYCTEYIKQ